MKSIQFPQLERLVTFLGQYRYVLLMMVVGVVLLLLPGGEEEGVALNLETVDEVVAVEEISSLEERLSVALSQIAGAGETQVILTLEDSGQRVLAENLEQDDTAATSETVILSDASRGETVVELQSISPTFRGALVVSQGASSSAVQLELISAVSVLTGLPTNKIAICTAG